MVHDDFAPRAVIFDLDGTLVDSMPFVLRAFAHALAPFRPDMGAGEIFHRLGGPPRRILREVLGDEAKTEEALRRLEAFGFEDGARVRPFSGMRELLELLREREVSMAVWTGRDRVTTGQILAAHGLGAFFAVVVCGDDFKTHKPHPEGLVHILQSLGVGAADALYVGDADVDVLAGREAGVRTLLIGHAREVSTEVKDKAWRNCAEPADAYRCVRDTVEGANYTRY